LADRKIYGQALHITVNASSLPSSLVMADSLSLKNVLYFLIDNLRFLSAFFAILIGLASNWSCWGDPKGQAA